MSAGGANYAQMAGMAAEAVGAAMQSYAALKDARKMESTFNAALKQQYKYRQQGKEAFDLSLAQATPEVAQQQIQGGANTRMAGYEMAAQSPLGFTTAPTTSQMRDVAAGQMAGKQRAQLGGYSDWALQQSIKNVQAQNRLNQISSFAGGQAQILPYAMYDAQHAYDKLAAAGAILQTAGSGAAGSLNFGASQQQSQGQLMYPTGSPNSSNQSIYGGSGNLPSNFGDLSPEQQSQYRNAFNYYNDPYYGYGQYYAPGAFE